MLKPLVALLAGTLVVGQAQAQGMAAAAEKEKERRAKQQQESAGKRYDDATLATSTGTLSNDPSVPPAATSSARGGGTLRSGTSSSSGSRSGSSGSSTWPGSSASGTGEEHWRSRAQQLRAAVTSAEAQVKKAEADAQRAGLVVPGPRAAPCQAGAERLPGEGSIALRERSKKTVTCDAEGMRQDTARAAQGLVEAARRVLDKARADLAALDDQARRAGAQPGWIR